MHRRMLLASVAGLTLLAGLPKGAAAAETVLNVITAGSENMVDYVTDYLAPKFNAMRPDVEVRVTGTGPGDAGSQMIYEKLEAQKAAGTASADVDVAVVPIRLFDRRFVFSTDDSSFRPTIRHFERRFVFSTDDSSFRPTIRHCERRFVIASEAKQSLHS
jgi:hypothetical protein